MNVDGGEAGWRPAGALEVMETQISGRGVAWWPGWWSGGEGKRERRKNGVAGSEKGFGWAEDVEVLRVCCSDSCKAPHVCLCFVGENTSKPRRGPIQNHIGWLPQFGQHGPNDAGGLRGLH